MQNPRKGRMAGKDWFAEKEPRLNFEESRKSQLWSIDDI
jgi:hypothetical protein